MLPNDPVGVADFETDPFGDLVAARETRAVNTVLDQLEPRFGRVDAGKLHVEPKTMSTQTSAEAVRRHYQTALGPAFVPIPLSAPPGSWATGWSDGTQIVALVAVEPHDGVKISPITLITNLSR